MWIRLVESRKGDRRYFIAHPAEERPLVLAFHGRAQEVDGTKGEILGIDRDFVGMSNLEAACKQRSIGIVFFEGLRRRGESRGGRDWNTATASDGDWPLRHDNQDVDFVVDTVDSLRQRYVHDGRIIVAGFSNGATFAQYVASALREYLIGAIYHSGGIAKPIGKFGLDPISHPVVIACEEGGALDIPKRRRLKLAKRLAEASRGAGARVREFYRRDSHRWRAEENDAYFGMLDL